ncbi:IS66 family insertion sequence element accessory protein TnpB [Mesorhizobium sp. M4B.F.Ca.ET.143.01.1.1]|uniref:IS66 family insertion sequence element accessory protein TnpB n=1 Tax=Mesorhizobium sp. M4B.F.Ca.ET.143.01.1.1 TaxID=2563947 RepID=UPI001AED1F7F|nr:IS66 family insertion sequence element accessory protein TnpB [Mesorhizobium sp. M4B.F.Ca.ET.143.01.1.1]
MANEVSGYGAAVEDGSAIFCFRGRKGHIIKILAHDDQGFCLFTKRLTDGCFAWPATKDQVVVSLYAYAEGRLLTRTLRR